MKELVNRLNEARKAYYEGESIMSDKEYDNLYKKATPYFTINLFILDFCNFS